MTLPSLRTALEGVFLENGWAILNPGGVLPVRDIHKSVIRAIPSEMIDKLLACYPQPSREELRRLFAQHHNAHSSAQEWQERLMDDLLAWATRDQEKIWCDHCQWYPTRPSKQAGWRLVDGENVVPISTAWRTCPICRTERPSDA